MCSCYTCDVTVVNSLSLDSENTNLASAEQILTVVSHNCVSSGTLIPTVWDHLYQKQDEIACAIMKPYSLGS